MQLFNIKLPIHRWEVDLARFGKRLESTPTDLCLEDRRAFAPVDDPFASLEEEMANLLGRSGPSNP